MPYMGDNYLIWQDLSSVLSSAVTVIIKAVLPNIYRLKPTRCC